MRRLVLFLGLAAAALWPTLALAQLPPALAEAEHAYERAQVEGDRAALERPIAEDFVLVGGDGSRTDRAGHIEGFTAEGLEIDPVVVREPVEYVWSDGAALGGTAELAGAFNGERFSRTLRYIDVWALRGGEWKVVYGQATRIPAASSPAS